MKYINGGKYPEKQVGKYVYAVKEGKYCKGRQYVHIQLSVDHNVIKDYCYTTLQGRWMNKV